MPPRSPRKPRVTGLSHQSHTAFTHSKPIRHNRRVGVRACNELARKPKETQSNTNQIMKLSLKNSLPDKACSFVATTTALAAMAASNVFADNVRVFNKTVSGVASGNPVMENNLFEVSPLD